MEVTRAEFIKSVVGSHNLIVDDLPQISFVGRSNVGKSSVINKLVNQKKLVKSSSKPGKTQHINFFLINEDTYFVDLPGYGYAKLGLKYREKLRRLILWYFISGEAPVTKVVVIIDAKAGLREFDVEMIAVLREHNHPFIVVANKVDKLNQKKLHKSLIQIQGKLGDEIEIFQFSAKTGKGREKLLNNLLSE
ncbi:MAG: ribosome biogenesis GTP-binding protein YihA/YsxC [Candidatus Moraniibacteriota bacterium]|jgi:GTP-binding protein